MNKPQQGEVYRHHSGTLYEVLQPVFDAETGERMVAYQQKIELMKPLDVRIYIHTVENFMREGRFERVK